VECAAGHVEPAAGAKGEAFGSAQALVLHERAEDRADNEGFRPPPPTTSLHGASTSPLFFRKIRDGVTSALERIKTGQRIRVDGTRGFVQILEAS